MIHRKDVVAVIVMLSIMSSILSSLLIPPTPVQAVPAAKIVFTFDDGWEDQYTYAFPIMQAAGFKGTIFVMRDTVEDQWPLMASQSQLNALYNAGWDVSNHTTNHDDNGADTSSARLAVLETEYRDNQNWILSKGWTRGAYHTCYPSGNFSSQLITRLQGIGALTGRSTISGLQSIPVSNYFTIPVQYVDSLYDGDIEYVEGQIDSAIATGKTIVLMIHRVMPTLVDNLVTTTADFQQLVNYAKTRVNNNSLAVMTMSEWYNAVAGVNHAPVAVNDAYNDKEDSTLYINAPGVLTNDTDIDGDTLTATKITNPAHGTLTLNANGSFTYTPDANYNGPDSFTYRANDGALNSNTATVTITVGAVNDAPVAVNDAYNATEDTTLNIAAKGVLTNDTDIDSANLTAVKVTDPAHGTLVLNANGSFTYTPNANYNGTDSFTYKANDGALNSNTATVTITVAAANKAPVAVADAYNATEDTTLNIAAKGVLTNDTDLDSANLTAVKVTDPAHGTLTLNANGSFTYTPDANYSGTDSFTYKANDGALDSNTATVTITVAAVNDAPVAVNDAYNATEDTTLNIAAKGVLTNDTDIDSANLTAVKVTDPAHGTLVLNANGSFTYTPDANYSGTDSFTYKANDGALDSNTATVTINVSQNMEGDVNLDGYVTITDAMLIAQYKAGLLILTEKQLQCADTTDDGIVSIADAMHISQWLVDPNGSLGVLFKPLWESPADDSMLQPIPK